MKVGDVVRLKLEGMQGCYADVLELEKGGAARVQIPLPVSENLPDYLEKFAVTSRVVLVKPGEFELLRIRRGIDQNPHRSKQDVETPREFIDAIEARFRVKIALDLAANAGNAKAFRFISPEEDSLKVDWEPLFRRLRSDEAAYLNPEFGQIKEFAKKCAEHSNAKIFLLTPMTNAKWYREFIRPYARSLDLSPRIKFVGHTGGYIKDLSLHCYGFGGKPGRESWEWKKPWPLPAATSGA